MSLKQNIFYNISYQIVLIITPLITAPYISRTIGAEGIGLHSYNYTIAYFFVLFAMLGINNYGTRKIATIKDNKELLSKTFSSIYFFQLFISLIIIILYALYVVFVAKGSTISSILFLFVISACIDINWFLFGLDKFKITVIRSVIVRLITLCALFIFVKDSSDLWVYVLINSLGILANQFVIWLLAFKYTILKKVTISEITSHLKPNLILFIPVIAMSIYTSVDTLILGVLTDMTQLGYYENTIRIVKIPMGIIVALGTVMLPRMSNLASLSKKEESDSLIEQSMFYVIFIASSLTFGIAGIAPIFAPVFFGDEFVEVGRLITYMTPTILIIAWANVIRTQYLIPNHKDKIYVLSVFWGAVVNIVVNLFLIPFYGALGAVIASIAAEAAVCLCQTFMVRTKIDLIQYIKNSWMFIPIGAVMFITVRWIGELNGTSIVTLIIQISVGAVIYLSLSLAYLLIIKRTSINGILKYIKR